MQCPSRHRCSVGDHSVLSDDFWPSGRLFFSLEIAPGPLAGASAFLVVFLFRNSSWPSGRLFFSLGAFRNSSWPSNRRHCSLSGASVQE